MIIKLNICFAFQIFFSVCYVSSMSLLQRNFLGGSAEPDKDLADLILSKGYLPNERELLKHGKGNKFVNDANYLLSKLPDLELIKLLDEHPMKKEFDVKDLVQIALEDDIKHELNEERASVSDKFLQSTQVNSQTAVQQVNQPYFRLDNKPVLSQSNSKNYINYNALQKINTLLNGQPQENEDDDSNREMLFDVLVAQLKALCCKRPKGKKHVKTLVERNYPSLYLPSVSNNANYKSNSEYKPQNVYRTVPRTTEHLFLILNEEIKSNVSDDLISVDPESLGKNSSVLLLGPLNRPLSDEQLQVVMKRISNELSKPEYSSILKQLSEGTLQSPNLSLMKNFITGPETRRYIKPHRCNYQSKLARVFGGTTWLLCTGYLNLNTPSLYD